MIGTIDVEICAACPEAPLYPLRAFINSPSTLRLRNVPRKIGAWVITAVHIAAHYPTDEITTAQCVQTGGVWVGTLAGCGTAGSSTQGYTVFADGIDEHGNPVQGYVLGKGDVEIIAADGTITPTETTHYVHLLSAASATPKDGDMYPDGNGYMIVQGGEAHALGMTAEDLTAYAKLSDVQAVDNALSGYLPLSGGRANTISGDLYLRPSRGLVLGDWAILQEQGVLQIYNGDIGMGYCLTRDISAGQQELTRLATELDLARIDAQIGDISTLIHNI